MRHFDFFRTNPMANKDEWDNQDGDGSDLLADCRRMLRYARKNGLTLSDQLAQDVTELDRMLTDHDIPPVSDFGQSFIHKFWPSADSTAKPDAEAVDVGRLIQSVHGELSQVIAPATALTLLISEPPPGRHHRIFGGMPPLVRAAALLAFFSSLAFLGSAGFVAKNDFGNTDGRTKVSNPRDKQQTTSTGAPA